MHACFNRHNEQLFLSIVNKSQPRYNKSSKNTSTTTNAVWYPDSGASDHITNYSTQIQASTNNASRAITVANGKSLPVLDTWSSTLFLDNRPIHVNNILLAPSITKNLLSVYKFCADNLVTLRFDNSHVYLTDPLSKSEEIVIGDTKEGLYQIHLNQCKWSEQLQFNQFGDLASTSWTHLWKNYSENI